MAAVIASIAAAVLAAGGLTACGGSQTGGSQSHGSQKHLTPVPGRVATFNLTNPQHPPELALANWIQTVRPEMIVFEEACVSVTDRVARFLSEDADLHYHVVHGAVVSSLARCGAGEHGAGWSGNAILSANPVTASGIWVYHVGGPHGPAGDELRGYVYAKTTVNGSPATVYATQLSQHRSALAGARTAQVKELADGAHGADPRTNSIVLGDFNTVPNEPVLSTMRRYWKDADPSCGAAPTPACTPTQVGARKKLDYIWLKPGFYPASPGISTVRTVVPANLVDKLGYDEYTDHDLTYADLPKAKNAPPAPPPKPAEEDCARVRARGEKGPCVNSYLFAGPRPPSSTPEMEVAPSTMHVGSNLTLGSLHWSSWGGTRVRAMGRILGTNCQPSCAEGTPTDYGSAEVELFGLTTSSHWGQTYTCGRARKSGQSWSSLDPSLKHVCAKAR